MTAATGPASPFRGFRPLLPPSVPRLPPIPPLDYLLSLTDRTGTIQHATCDVPNRSTGYCTDDLARLLIVAVRAGRLSKALAPAALELCRTALAFLGHAQLPDGRFHNFMSYERTWLDDAGSEDSHGRAIWALGVGARHAPTFGMRRFARECLERALPAIASLEHVRPRAFAALGLVEALRAADDDGDPHHGQRATYREILATIGRGVLEAVRSQSREGWTWFGDVMTYDNARPCEALLRAGDVLNDPSLLHAGFETLAFFERTTIRDGVFFPIGNEGWYPRGGTIAAYGQQPLEAAALVDAALEAAKITARRPVAGFPPPGAFATTAAIALGWFHGHNELGVSLVTGSGACGDGIEASGVSLNAGAESTLAYLAAAYAMATPPDVAIETAAFADTPVVRGVSAPAG